MMSVITSGQWAQLQLSQRSPLMTSIVTRCVHCVLCQHCAASSSRCCRMCAMWMWSEFLCWQATRLSDSLYAKIIYDYTILDRVAIVKFRPNQTTHQTTSDDASNCSAIIVNARGAELRRGNTSLLYADEHTEYVPYSWWQYDFTEFETRRTELLNTSVAIACCFWLA